MQTIYAARSLLGRLLDPAGQSSGDFVPQLTGLACLLMQVCERSRPVVLATVMLRHDGEYATRHAINVALLAGLALHDMGLARVRRLPVVCAALTMNIGMQALQNGLAHQAGVLTSEQRASMQSHPQRGCEILTSLGVSDPLWLACVTQHHEMPDGGGYPLHLHDAQIRFEVRLLSLLDHYCALLNRNAWRRGYPADSALFATLADSTHPVDVKLGELLTRTIGIYPPGTLVQLLNGEKGVVVRAGQTMPVMVVLQDRHGNRLQERLERDCAHAQFCIVAVLEPHQLGGVVDMQQIWGAEAAGPQ